MSIDASHFGEITTQFHMLWSGRESSPFLCWSLLNVLHCSSIPNQCDPFFTVQPDATSDHSWYCSVTLDGSDQFSSSESSEETDGMSIGVEIVEIVVVRLVGTNESER